MTKVDKKALMQKHIKQAKSSEWDDLACSIISIEDLIKKEKNSKRLKSLETKLKVFEAEKSLRVFKLFDMDYFLNKIYEEVVYLDEDGEGEGF